MYFRYFVIFSPWKRVGPFKLTNLGPHNPRMLCAKFGWNLPNGSGEEDENVKSLRQRQRERHQRTMASMIRQAILPMDILSWKCKLISYRLDIILILVNRRISLYFIITILIFPCFSSNKKNRKRNILCVIYLKEFISSFLQGNLRVAANTKWFHPRNARWRLFWWLQRSLHWLNR